MIVIGCDPGPEKSALVVFNGTTMLVVDSIFEINSTVEEWLDNLSVGENRPRMVLAIEKIESFGMAVGAEVFETVFHSGRFAKAFAPRRVDRISRRVIKQHLCHTARATDANIRQSLIDRFGPGTEKAIGTKKEPGPLYTLKGHLWAAFAVAITWWDQNANRPEEVRPGVRADF